MANTFIFLDQFLQMLRGGPWQEGGGDSGKDVMSLLRHRDVERDGLSSLGK